MADWNEVENFIKEAKQKLIAIEKKLNLETGYHLDIELPEKLPTKAEVKQFQKDQNARPFVAELPKEEE